jgi:hypothetical protein
MESLADLLEDWRLPPRGKWLSRERNGKMWKLLYTYIKEVEISYYGKLITSRDLQTEMVVTFLDYVGTVLDSDAYECLQYLKHNYLKIITQVYWLELGISTLVDEVFTNFNANVIAYCCKKDISRESQVLRVFRKRYKSRTGREPSENNEKTFRRQLRYDPSALTGFILEKEPPHLTVI